jgi:hypothetical protein
MSLSGYSEEWESDSDEILDYDSPPHKSNNCKGSTVACTMLPPGALPGSGKSQQKYKGKGIKLVGKITNLGGCTKLPAVNFSPKC